jgi:sec-independent protein translocase protein TatA
MGPLGWPETVFILFLAFILFGPKKLPELGRTVGKAFADFQRAKGELTVAFERETKQLGLDQETLTSFANLHRVDAFDASPPASGYEHFYGSEPYVPAVVRKPAPGADEPEVLAELPE